MFFFSFLRGNKTICLVHSVACHGVFDGSPCFEGTSDWFSKPDRCCYRDETRWTDNQRIISFQSVVFNLLPIQKFTQNTCAELNRRNIVCLSIPFFRSRKLAVHHPHVITVNSSNRVCFDLLTRLTPKQPHFAVAAVTFQAVFPRGLPTPESSQSKLALLWPRQTADRNAAQHLVFPKQ